MIKADDENIRGYKQWEKMKLECSKRSKIKDKKNKMRVLIKHDIKKNLHTNKR